MRQDSVETELDVPYYLDSETHIGFHQTVAYSKLTCVFADCIWH